MISHQPQSSPFATARSLLSAVVRLLRNRRELRDLDAAQLLDAGITAEKLREATDWRAYVTCERATTMLAAPAFSTTDGHDVLAAMAVKAANAESPRVRVLRQAANTNSGRPAATTLRSAA